MTAAPAIAVIVPNYNHAPYLPRRIESILGQTRGDFELLILDDRSPDDSRAVIEDYARRDPRIRFAFNERNSGNTYRQWEKGLALTSAPYVWIAESDDWAEPTLLARLGGKLDGEEGIGLAFCETNIVDAAGEHLCGYFDRWRASGHSNYDLDALDREFVMDGRDYLRAFMIPWNTIPNASAVLFRRAAIEAIGGPVTSMRLCGDWLTYCKILARFAVGHVPERLNHFREHAVNVRSSVKGELLVHEALEVEAWIAAELGPLPPTTRTTLRRFYAQVLLAMERQDAAMKTPLGRAPAILKRAHSASPTLLGPTAAILLREHASALASRLGLKR